jgi:hypothetical protein
MGWLTESFRQGNNADLLNWLVEEGWFVFEKEEETLSSRGLDEKHMEDGREEWSGEEVTSRSGVAAVKVVFGQRLMTEMWGVVYGDLVATLSSIARENFSLDTCTSRNHTVEPPLPPATWRQSFNHGGPQEQTSKERRIQNCQTRKARRGTQEEVLQAESTCQSVLRSPIDLASNFSVQ